MKKIIFNYILILLSVNSFVLIAQPGRGNKLIKIKIDNYLTKSVTSGFSGAVLVAKNGKIILNKGYGYADKENEILKTPSFVFDIGSVSKQFTAAVIMELVQYNKLKMTSPLSNFIKGISYDKKDITIH